MRVDGCCRRLRDIVCVGLSQIVFARHNREMRRSETPFAGLFAEHGGKRLKNKYPLGRGNSEKTTRRASVSSPSSILGDLVLYFWSSSMKVFNFSLISPTLIGLLDQFASLHSIPPSFPPSCRARPFEAVWVVVVIVAFLTWWLLFRKEYDE